MTTTQQRPIKVLNALWLLGVGGIENLLVNVLRRLDRERFQMDFLVASQFEQHYDETVRALGSRLVLGKQSNDPWRSERELAAINRRFGPYDVIHSHRHFSGVALLRAAHRLGIPVRIAHGHAIRRGEGPPMDRIGFAVARHLTRKHCTHGLAVSRDAGRSLFGEGWEADRRFELLPGAVDFTPFLAENRRSQVRRALQLPDDAIAIAHTGRFVGSKNHRFIVAVARALCRLSERHHFLLIGDGPLLQPIRELVDYEGLGHRVRFAGSRSDVPELLLAMDAFIFPSLTEAFGLAAVEAQAAGLTCFLSDQVVPEVDVVPELLQRLPLAAGPGFWAERILAHGPPRISQQQALARCRASRLNIDAYVDSLSEIYRSAADA